MMGSDRDKTTPQWITEAEEALNRTGDALKTAWNETREARMSTLEAAREAASRLGKAIDEGLDAARHNWDSSHSTGPEDKTSAKSGTEPDAAAELDEEE